LASVAACWCGRRRRRSGALIHPEDFAFRFLARVSAWVAVVGVDVDSIVASWQLIRALEEVKLSIAVGCARPDQIVTSGSDWRAITRWRPSEESERARRIAKSETLNVEIARDVRFVLSVGIGARVCVDFDRAAVVVLSQTGGE